MNVRPALCLDLDGTVRRSESGKTFISGIGDIEIMPGIKQLMYEYHSHDFVIIGISNQGGVAHGFKTELEVAEEMEYMKTVLPFHFLCWCVFMEGGKVIGFNKRSLCRKPNIGMLAVAEEKISSELGIMIDWDNSIFVGDRPEDQECAKNAGVKFHWIDDFLKMQHVFAPRPHKKTVYVQHIVSAMEDWVQRCLICGEIISDYRNSAWPVGDPPPRGWQPGPICVSKGTNPTIYMPPDGVNKEDEIIECKNLEQ